MCQLEKRVVGVEAGDIFDCVAADPSFCVTSRALPDNSSDK